MSSTDDNAILFRLIVNSVDQYAVFMIDETGTIVSWNPGVRALFGYEEAEFVGENTMLIFTPEDQERGAAELEMRAALEHGKAEDRRWHMRKDGTRFWANGMLIPLHAGHQLLGFAKIMRDDTEQKRLEDEVAESNRMKDQFLATLSHELRTPLNAILGWVRLLDSGDLDPEMLSTALEVIERNALAQQHLIEDVLDISRIVTGKLKLESAAVNLNDVAFSAAESFRPQIESKGIRLSVIVPDVANVVTGDEVRLRQVFSNLLSNAYKFTSQGTIEIGVRRDGRWVRVTVRDSGLGISPEFLPLIFDRFRQADSSSTRVHSGLGIGLSLVRTLVELHGGTVEAASEGEGCGATMTVSLPLLTLQSAGVSAGPEPERRSIGRPLDGLRVMVVDDDYDARALLDTLLRRHGADVCTFATVDKALEEYQRCRPDVVVSDLAMPNRDGFGLIAALRELDSARPDPPVAIALSAYAKSDVRDRALAEGYRSYMVKPVHPNELVTMVATLVGRQVDEPDRAG